MKNDRSGPKSGPKRERKPDSKPSTKREPRSGDSAGPKKDYKSDAKSGVGSAAKREQRLELESSLKKDFRSQSKLGAKTPPKTNPKRESAAVAKKDFGTEAKPAPKKESGGSFSPKLGLTRPGPKPPEARKSAPDTKTERGPTQAFPPKRYINVYLALGSNMGDRKANLLEAALSIDKNVGKIARKSRIYETEPWGKTNQDSYLNQVLMVNTTLDPRDLLEVITHIEQEMGRVRTEKWAPRTIDIDILFYGKRVIRDKGLDIPHPELHKRAFVLVPLMEITPELEHPVLKLPIDELYMACKDPAEVVMID